MAYFSFDNPRKGSSGPMLKEERDRAGRHKAPLDDLMSVGSNPGVIGGPASKGSDNVNPLASIFGAGGDDASTTFFGMDAPMNNEPQGRDKGGENDGNSFLAAIFKAALGGGQMQCLSARLELVLHDSIEKDKDKDDGTLTTPSETSPAMAVNVVKGVEMEEDARLCKARRLALAAPTVHDRLYQHFELSYSLSGTNTIRTMKGTFSKPVPYFTCHSVRIEYGDVKHITGPGLAGFTGVLGKKRVEMNFVVGSVRVSAELVDELRDIYVVAGKGWWPIA
ncbi:hypothetical protein CVT24_005517 [Panaeolus cyanescens]|uniref:Uncharacterized protein n=1 Tax=Panaeolus cyanescens TaxID=181874 RepID=A0A409YC37_9AGAR|nr:hypothetical protein CVT24_005517 [Panaeolus cyanescens]